jgi:transposase
MQYIAFDSHKHYTFASAEDEATGEVREARIPHERGELQRFLGGCEAGSPVAVETIGNWYWIVDEIEAAGFQPRLVHARKAKVMMGMINKTDKLDARGMNRLQRTGTLPVVWIPPGELRDQRDLPRTRMTLVRQRTRLKNRVHATLAKYALTIQGVSDIFGVRGRELIAAKMKELPEHTAFATQRLLDELEILQGHIAEFERRMESVFEETEEIKLLRTLPGVGFTLAVVIATEVGCVGRFGGADKLASYAGTTPRVHASGGKIRYGQLRSDVNRYLKWAFVEAGSSICLNRSRNPHRHVSQLYQRVKTRKGHPKAIGAVARHLSEATYWILTKREPYREPSSRKVSSTKG